MKQHLIAIKLSCINFNDIISIIIENGSKRLSSYVCVANVHMLIEAQQNEDFAKIVNQADLITTDGIPLVWGLQLLHGLKQERVAGMDLLPALLHSAEEIGQSVFFYGGTVEMMGAMELYLSKNYSKLKYGM